MHHLLPDEIHTSSLISSTFKKCCTASERERKMAHLLSSQAFFRNPKACPLDRSVSSISSFISGNSCCSVSASFNLNFPAQLFTSSDTSHHKLSVSCRQSEYFEQSPRFTVGAPSDSSYSSQGPKPATGLPPRYFVGHSIYKGKAALTVDPRAPEFVPLESGAFKISREGYVLLQFAPAAGVRQYDWTRKQVFSLSVSEIGSLISLGPRESCEFFHDPNKGKSDEGKVRKVLKVEPLPDGSGHFFNLSVQNKLLNMDESIYIPISKAEFAVLGAAFNFILPYLMGWHAFASSVKPEEFGRVNNTNPGARTSYEWSR